MNNTENMWDFPVMEGVSFPNANRVHPLMQRRVEKLIHELGKDQNIRRLILFGSSLEFRCSNTSDIDLYIEKREPEKSWRICRSWTVKQILLQICRQITNYIRK